MDEGETQKYGNSDSKEMANGDVFAIESYRVMFKS